MDLEELAQRCAAAQTASAEASNALASMLYQRRAQHGGLRLEDMRLRFALAAVDREVVNLSQTLILLNDAILEAKMAAPRVLSVETAASSQPPREA